jgi:uncharacterized membrane protein
MTDLEYSIESANRQSSRLERLIHFLSQRWIWVFTLLYGLFVGLPFLAPVFMFWGWESGAKVIYTIYMFLCHQLPERSIFLFGRKAMYSLEEIQSVWQDSLNPFVLRQFIGNPEMGWKVAWSDRMVAMYASILVFGLLWWAVRRLTPSLPWWGFLLLLVPMAVDGTTHMISDLWGVEQGFRQTNLWLVALTNDALPGSFYHGNALGSFNSLMRWLSGILVGFAVVWFGFPYLNGAFTAITPDRSYYTS